MSRHRWPLTAALLCALLPGPAPAAEPPWLSDVPPHAGRRGAPHGHGGPVELRRGVAYKHLWLRLGTPAGALGVEDVGAVGPLRVFGPDGVAREVPLELDPAHGLLHASFAMPEEGFYDAYTARDAVKDGVREVVVAKAEVLKHSCREGHDRVRELMPPRRAAAVPLEIVRERLPHEDFHTLIGFGDEVSFLVLQRGEPVSGAQVTIVTQHGWRNQAVSDDRGRVRFAMIRDYYPPWNEFEKRRAQRYVVHATYGVPEGGTRDGAAFGRTVYVTSFAGSYHPSARDYRSHAYGLGLGVFALTSSGVGVYLFRRRRRLPLREVRFDG